MIIQKQVVYFVEFLDVFKKKNKKKIYWLVMLIESHMKMFMVKDLMIKNLIKKKIFSLFITMENLKFWKWKVFSFLKKDEEEKLDDTVHESSETQTEEVMNLDNQAPESEESLPQSNEQSESVETAEPVDNSTLLSGSVNTDNQEM